MGFKISETSGIIKDGETEVATYEHTLNSMQKGFAGISRGAIVAGSAIALLSSLFSRLGFEEAAESLSFVSTAVVGIGMAMTTISPIITKISGKLIAKGLET
jgi:hypothetical protein